MKAIALVRFDYDDRRDADEQGERFRQVAAGSVGEPDDMKGHSFRRAPGLREGQSRCNDGGMSMLPAVAGTNFAL